MDVLLNAPIPWSGLGWGALIFVAVLAIIRGDLVPRRTHEEWVEQYREALNIERAAHTRTRETLAELVREYGRTADRVLTSLPVDSDPGPGG